VALFRRGGTALMLKEIRTHVPGHLAKFFEGVLIARGADQALRTKVEMVNFKKAIMLMQKQLEETEANLAVFVAMVEWKSAFGLKLAKALDECRGILHAVRDVRTSTSAICKVHQRTAQSRATSAAVTAASARLSRMRAQTARFPTTERLFIASDSAIARMPATMSLPCAPPRDRVPVRSYRPLTCSALTVFVRGGDAGLGRQELRAGPRSQSPPSVDSDLSRAPGCNLQPATCNLQLATCNLQPLGHALGAPA
jgi:hypothetical protein